MPTPRTPQYLSVEERRAEGKRAREHAPRSSIGTWRPSPDRPDPVATLSEQDDTREPDLVPIRHGRMMVSPFTFYRGGARIMAWDLASVATSGLKVQLCGDAHLSNFGVFASPERQLLFDINDFDETLPGPFEWDVARLAASFVIASRNNGFTEEEARVSAVAAATAYREATAGFAQMRTLEIWYAHLPAEEILGLGAHAEIEGVDPTAGWTTRGRADSLQALHEAGRDGRRALPDRVAAPGGHADPRPRPT